MVTQTRRGSTGRSGFTLMELLTVIAIIAILAALIFPVFGAARANARKGHCRTNQQAIIQALKMYYDDWGVYPDALYGIQYGIGVTAPASAFALRLAQEYVKDRAAFTCPNHPDSLKNSDVMVQPIDPRTGAGAVDGAGRPLYFPARDSYDLHYRPNTAVGTVYLGYSRKWSLGAAGLADNPRQLVYRNSPETTVVSWCLNHTSQNAAGTPQPNTMAVVTFLSGRVQEIPVDRMLWPPAGAQEPWLTMPKP